VNRPPTGEEMRAGRQAETQFGRALRQLGIAYIPAGSPQAKGRVERSFQTDQDRLVKELRLQGISDIPSANAYLEAEYVPMGVHGASVLVGGRPPADYPWRQPFQKKRTFLLCGKEDISTLRRQAVGEGLTPGVRSARIGLPRFNRGRRSQADQGAGLQILFPLSSQVLANTVITVAVISCG
jgi:hypothetical protein